MVLDTTLKNLPLTPEGIKTIREDDIYGGYQVMMTAKYDTLLMPLSINVSTGDASARSGVYLS